MGDRQVDTHMIAAQTVRDVRRQAQPRGCGRRVSELLAGLEGGMVSHLMAQYRNATQTLDPPQTNRNER